MVNKWSYKTPGIPDNMFIRGKVPMTKEEIRAVSISKMRLKEDFHVVDIGAGTGSISIEAGLICRSGKITSIERNSEGANLILRNAEKFNVNNIEVIHGEAVEALKNLKYFDRAFIGGSGGQLEEILKLCKEKLADEGVVVINSITIETLYEAIKILEKLGYSDIDVTSMSIAKGKSVGRYTMMEALNPIYIINAKKNKVIGDG